jgi:hypothetical protein
MSCNVLLQNNTRQMCAYYEGLIVPRDLRQCSPTELILERDIFSVERGFVNSPLELAKQIGH